MPFTKKDIYMKRWINSYRVSRGLSSVEDLRKDFIQFSAKIDIKNILYSMLLFYICAIGPKRVNIHE